MRSCILIVLSFGVLFAVNVQQQAADAPKDDGLKALEGTWLMVSGEEKGKTLAEEIVKGAKLNIVGDKHVVKVGDVTIIGTHKVDPSKKPKTIDASDTEGPFKGKTTLGIYKLKGDEFTVCFAPPGKDRPTEFTTKSGTAEILHVWKRQKN